MSEYHTFFNMITLPEERMDEALVAWNAVGEFMETQDGFVGSTLYRNRKDPRIAINHGRYTSVEAFMACVKSPEFQRLSQVLTDLGVERVAGLYDEVKSFAAGGS